MDHPRAPDRRGLRIDPLLAEVAGPLLGRTTFPDHGPIDCAVSGGADSLALLALAVAAGLEATAIHVDHGLRPGSAAEADVVAAAAERFDARFRSVSVDLEPGSNLEARARAARYAVLPTGVATGHTADDRAETMLLNLMRGAGPAGLGALRPGPRRPILALRRSETVAVCAALDLDVVEDPSNDDPVHRRNRVRHELLPLLGDISDRDPVPILVRQGELFAQLDADLQMLAAAVDATSALALRSAPVSLARAAVRIWLADEGVGDGYAVPGDAIERVLSVARLERRAMELPGGVRVSRSEGRLSVTHPPSAGAT